MQKILEQLRLEDALLSVTTVDGKQLRRVKIREAGNSTVMLGYPNSDASRFLRDFSVESCHAELA